MYVGQELFNVKNDFNDTIPKYLRLNVLIITKFIERSRSKSPKK